MKTMIKRFLLLAVLVALFAALTVTAQAADTIDANLVFFPETRLTVYVNGTWSPDLSDSYGAGDTVTVTAPAVSGKTFSHWEADGSVVSYANPLNLTMNAHTTLYAVYANSAPTAQAVAGFTSVTRTNDGKQISFQAIAYPNGGTVEGAGIVYSTTATGDSLVIGGTAVTNVAAESVTDTTVTLPESVLDSNNCWTLQITPTGVDTVYHARAYVTSGGTTTYGDVKDVKLSELQNGVSLIGKPDGIDDVLDDLRETFDPGSDDSGDSGDSGDNTPGYSGVGGGTSTYTPTVAEAKNGKVTVDPKAAAEGAKVTVTATPDEGYELDTLTVKDANGKDVAVTKNADGTYTYTQPAGKVTVTATFKAKAKETSTEGLTVAELLEMFDDLDPNGWYLDDVRYCVENGYMKGMGDNKFGPNLNVSRAMIAQLLWNMAGNPEPASAAPFGDVAEDAWYAKAVAWAYENGITKGTGAGFEPELDITREQLAVMLYNYAKLLGKGFTGLWSFQLDFPDAGDVSDWATEAISWMVMNGIINGTTDAEGNTILAPQGDATRAQLAAMVHRFCEAIAE